MKYFIQLVLLLFFSCSSLKNKESDTIPYVFPPEVTNIISKQILETGELCFFYLSKIDSKWNLYILKSDNEELKNNILKNTNRKVYINRRFYPLILESDEKFSISQNGEYLLNSDGFLPLEREYYIFNQAFRVVFLTNGKVEYSGY